MTSRSEFVGEGWVANVEMIDGVVAIDLLLVGLGASGRARLVLPVRGTSDALAALAAVLYADELLLRHAVRVHLDQHSEVSEVGSRSPALAKMASVADVAKRAKRAKQAPCAHRIRR